MRLGDEGSASLKFVTLGVGLLLPLLYLVVAVSVVQANWLLVEGLARTSASAVAVSTDEARSEATIAAARVAAAVGNGIDPARIGIGVSCSPDPTRCHEAGALVEARVTVAVPLPILGGVPGLPSTIELSAVADQRVSRFGALRGEPQ